MARRKEAKFACEHKSSDLPTGQTAPYKTLGRAYHTHRCKSSATEDWKGEMET